MFDKYCVFGYVFTITKIGTWLLFFSVYIIHSRTFGSGNWSTRGCHMNNNKSSVSRTVCECNHLTHFAILLSPKPQELSKPVVISLQIIGYIGVSVSLVAMGITIITFIMLR